MSQGIFDNIVPSTTSGNQLASLLNSFKDAYVSGNSGVSRPSQLTAGGFWVDTTNGPTTWDFKFYDGIQDITVFTLNLTTGTSSIASADSSFEVAKVSDDSVGPIVKFLKERLASLGQVLTGDTIGEIKFYGTRNTGEETLQARIKSISLNDVTATEQGAYLAFETTTLGASSIAEVMRVIDAKVGIGTQTPENTLHVAGTGVRIEKQSDDADGADLLLKKKRIAGSGQVLNADVIGTVHFRSTDNLGGIVEAAAIEVSANETHSASAQGTKVVIKNTKVGQTTQTNQITIEDAVTVNTNLTVVGDLIVQGTTTTIDTANLNIKDANIVVNKGGTQATANAAKAGLQVETSDAAESQLGYDSSKASRFVIGEVGFESEVATVGHTQTFTNKTLTAPIINNPTRAGVKEDTEANLTIYAATATNGQWAFATDAKVMYQVIDGELVPAGSGGGGTTLSWESVSNAPVIEYTDGFKLFNFDNVSSHETYAVLTVPSSYRVGKPIKLKKGQFFCVSTTGKVLLKSSTALINSSTVLGTYANVRSSTNAEVTVAGVSNTITSVGDIDLTDATGMINAVAVQPGDKLKIKLFRDNASESAAAAEDAKLIINSFEPTFS